VRVADSGHLLIKCHAGCTAEAITKALGLDVSALMPAHRVPTRHRSGVRCQVSGVRAAAHHSPRPTPCPDGNLCSPPSRVFKTHAHAWAAVTKRSREPDQFWEYHDRDGELVGLVLRWNVSGGGKDIRPLARVPSADEGGGATRRSRTSRGQCSRVAEAAEWLASALRDGPQSAVNLKQRAKQDGVHERTLLRAKQRLGTIARHQGFGPEGLWAWQLPTA
jgi:hypothetical protein